MQESQDHLEHEAGVTLTAAEQVSDERLAAALARLASYERGREDGYDTGYAAGYAARQVDERIAQASLQAYEMRGR